MEVDIDYTFPKGYNLEMNSQLLQASISEDPYTEYEQVIDQKRPATLVEFGFVINIKGWKK